MTSHKEHFRPITATSSPLTMVSSFEANTLHWVVFHVEVETLALPACVSGSRSSRGVGLVITSRLNRRSIDWDRCNLFYCSCFDLKSLFPSMALACCAKSTYGQPSHTKKKNETFKIISGDNTCGRSRFKISKYQSFISDVICFSV